MRMKPKLDEFLGDLKYGARMLRKNPGFTAVAVFTLALGIGANTTIFSVIDHILLRPLPYRDPGRLVMICQRNLERGYRQTLVSAANLFDWRAQNTVFQDLAGEVYESFNLSGSGEPEHVHAAYVTANYFSVLGVRPILGRTFAAGEDQPEHRLAVLSHALWLRRFGADPDIAGKTITLSEALYTVVGVMPPEFRCFNPTDVTGRPTGDVQPQLWVAYQFTPEELKDRSGIYFLGVARLKPGVTVARAQSEMDVIAGRLARQFPRQKGWGAKVQALQEQVSGALRPALTTLLGTVGFVLLIACANVANLLLARSATRKKEFAIRAALGAGRARVIRQLLAESLSLALVGGALGGLLARGGIDALRAFGPAHVPRMNEVRLDGPALGFTLLVCLVAGVVFGLVPAMQAARPDLNEMLKAGGGGASRGIHRLRAGNLLVVSEVALGLVLLVGAGLMINSFVRLMRVSPGFEPEHLLALDITLPDAKYAELSKRIEVTRQIRERLLDIPDVKSVATVCGLPFGTMLNIGTRVSGEGRSPADPGEKFVGVGWRLVSPDYFKTMNTPLLSGRAFTGRDTANSTPVAMVNEALARRLYPGENPVGRRINVHSSTTNFAFSTNWCEIVGVVKDVKLTGLDAPAQPEAYRPDLQDCFWMLSVVLNSSLPSGSLAQMAQAGVTVVDRDIPVYNVRTMDRAISDSVAPRRFIMTLIGVFASLALVLTAVGIYGVVSYSVSQQTREIGIRIALGAPRAAVLALVLRQGMNFVVIGIGIGLAGSLALTRVITNQLFGIKANDAITLIGGAALLAGVALLACFIPARQAAKVDPMVALRAE